MSDNENVDKLNDIAILYELSLSIGQTLDLYGNVAKFVNLLSDRKNLNYISVWLQKGVVDIRDNGNEDYSLIYANPMSFVADSFLPSRHKIFDYLTNITCFQVSSDDDNFNDFVFEKDINTGTMVFFRLGDLGFLKIHNKNVSQVSVEEVNKLDLLMQQFTNSISACLYYERALYETEERAKSESKYRDIFYSITDAYAEVDFFTGNIHEISPSIKTILGYSREDLIGNSINSYYSYPDAARRIGKDILTSDKKEIVDYEVVLRSSSGKDVHCSYSMQLKFDDKGKPNKIVGTMRDITVRKQSEADVLEAEQKWRALVGNSPDRIMTIDKLGKVIFDNRRSIDESDSTHRVSACLSLSDDQLEKYKNCYEEAFGCKEVISAEILCSNNMWLLSRFVPVFQNEEVEFVMVIATDITEQKNLENNLNIAIVEAQTANEAKSRFLANMSHEIRNPMHAIKNNPLALLNTSLNSEQEDLLNGIIVSAGKLEETIDKILYFSKIESGRLNLNHSSFSLKLELSKNLEHAKIIPVNKDLNFILDIDEDIPNVLIGDKARILKVVSYLINNAVKFTNDGGEVSLKITLKDIENNKARILFSVEDTGIGIETNRLEDIFEIPNQIDAESNSQYVGSGLGLSISRKLVNKLGGELFVESKIGVGSKFFFLIELGIGDENTHTDKEVYSAINPDMLKGFRILIVEDDKIVQATTKIILNNWGATVLTADNGKIAVDMIEKDPNCADFVFMDIRMPVMNGIEATRVICNNLNWQKPIVALTGEATEETVIKCKDAGMKSLISKPSDLETMEAVLRTYLDIPDHPVNDNSKSEEKPDVIVEESEVDDTIIAYSTNELLEQVGGNPDVLKEILQMFCQESQSRVIKIEESFNSGNWKQLQSQAHTIKASLRLLKVDDLVDDCQKLEDLTKEQTYNDGMKPLVDRITVDVTKLIAQVKEDFDI